MSGTTKRALVLGCGGVAGGAWTIPTLASLQQQLDWDARDAEIIVGTSVGALLASLIGAGVSVETLLASQKGETEHHEFPWDHQQDWGTWYPPLPKLKLSAQQLIKHGLTGKASLVTAISGALPSGQMPLDSHDRVIRHFAGEEEWVSHNATWIIAVEDNSGERVAFGHHMAPNIPIEKAVRASYAVPGWCPPVEHGNSIYMDGGIASPTSADLLVNEEIDEVVVLAPMASSNTDNPNSLLSKIERKARNYMTGIVDREIAMLRNAGKKVIRLEPGPKDLSAIGFNMMDHRRRTRVLSTAIEQSETSVNQAIKNAY
ncbi:MAG: patatin-like phospholipase family protein [Pseudomonadales bacterium]|nr:patatin-like phospholipase family protein [Pseudomonadales bacterium]